jgi:hypothetical protein
VVADLVEAGDVLRREVEPVERLDELADGEPLVLGAQLAAHGAPHRVLLVAVADVGRRLPRPPVEGVPGDVVASGPVGLVGEARVVGREMDLDLAVVGRGDR